ncbi:MAG: adenylate/guanylate cyclase domain-containing protein [Cyanobacteriota bacterium]|nr:adenylate/guanylate cyclase domain-containing protein [Cyanobacteriota bacterium]
MQATQNSTLSGNILIVDDVADNLRLLSNILTERGYEVGKARSGAMALNAIRAEAPDLILLDINMPHMDGYEVCKRLKSDPATRDIPVIFISAIDGDLDKVKGLELGGIDYITKPFFNQEVVARVTNQLQIQALQKDLKKEQEKTESLLLNILPPVIVEELKHNQSATPVRFEEASFLFADIVRFTPSSREMPPDRVVDLLNDIFSIFDRLTQQHGVEKIRTIGDAYFIASGVPVPRRDHVEAIANMALDMQREIKRFAWPNGNPLQLRIGINTGGPVVGAVIGTQKFAYDVWGNDVNLASRMQSQGTAGRIQVSAATYDRLQNGYRLEKRGEIDIKGKGLMTTYWLLDRPEIARSLSPPFER